MKDAAHTADGRGIAPNTREAAFTPSAGVGTGNPTPGEENAPAGLVGGDLTKRPKRPQADTPRRALQLAEQAARAIEASGTLLAAAVGRMHDARLTAKRNGKPERDAAWVREWREILLVLDEHANALAAFLGGFMDAPCFRRIAQAAHQQELAECRAAVMRECAEGDPQGGDRGGAA